MNSLCPSCPACEDRCELSAYIRDDAHERLACELECPRSVARDPRGTCVYGECELASADVEKTFGVCRPLNAWSNPV